MRMERTLLPSRCVPGMAVVICIIDAPCECAAIPLLIIISSSSKRGTRPVEKSYFVGSQSQSEYAWGICRIMPL